MRIYIKNKAAKLKLLANKAHKQAQKLALAVVIGEIILVAGYSTALNYGALELLQPRTVIIEVAQASPVQIQPQPQAPKQPQEEIIDVERIADTIYSRESSRGKHNYSACTKQNKINGIGYGIPGNGKFMCFTSHEEEMETLKKWINRHIAEGMTEKELMCHYSGNNYIGCK